LDAKDRSEKDSDRDEVEGLTSSPARWQGDDRTGSDLINRVQGVLEGQMPSPWLKQVQIIKWDLICQHDQIFAEFFS
jgi:hypothetical protein